MQAAPFLVDSDSNVESLYRINFNEGFSERWLQEQLYRNPESLPFGEINPSYREVVPLCMEMNTTAGPIDLLYVTPQGKVVIVETKLWRNPEARRKVVGQILDYAKELQRWSYSDLQREVSRRREEKGNVPFRLVKDRFPETDESFFVDGVSRSLSQGDFMLIIAGDGIRSDAEAMVQFLENTANMRFTLAMIETAVYQTKNKSLTFIQPRTLFKTKEIQRTVYVNDVSDTLPADNIASIDKSQHTQNPLLEQYRLFWSDLVSDLQLDDPDQPMANPVAKGNIFFALPPSFATAWITLYFSKASSEVGCFARLARNEDGVFLYEGLKDDAEAIESEIPFKIRWDNTGHRIITTKSIKTDWPPVNDSEVKDFFQKAVNSFVNAFRPRLEKLSEQGL